MTSRKKKNAPRGAIRARKLIKLLESHALGETKMTPSQVSVALALLKIAEAEKKIAAAQSGKKGGKEDGKAHEDALSELG
jgi:hypothetical protein